MWVRKQYFIFQISRYKFFLTYLYLHPHSIQKDSYICIHIFIRLDMDFHIYDPDRIQIIQKQWHFCLLISPLSSNSNPDHNYQYTNIHIMHIQTQPIPDISLIILCMKKTNPRPTRDTKATKDV